MIPHTHSLAVGDLTFRLDGGTGMVRAIRFRGHEVLRGIYPAVRDESWATLPFELQPPLIESSIDHLRIELNARVASPAIHLDWTAVIDARVTELRYSWSARVGKAFLTNRTGLCVLHPAEIAGAPCVLEHVDGSRIASWFPQTIAPQQPFTSLRAITHPFGDHAEAEIRCEGEVFETEDQRNWSDASFKTYCRPLEWKRPYRLPRGRTIEHTVTLSLRGNPSPARTSAPASPLPHPAVRPLPQVGFTITEPLPTRSRERLQAMRPAFLRVETAVAQLRETLAWARRESELLPSKLCIAVQPADTNVPRRDLVPPDCPVQLFSARADSVSTEILEAWRNAGFRDLGTGTTQNFTELNRDRPPAHGRHRTIAFGINAQVHAFDDASVLETLSQHGALARHAHVIGGGRPVVVAPIVLGPYPQSQDVRLLGEFAALWVASSLVQLAKAGSVEAAAYFVVNGRNSFETHADPTPVERLFQLVGSASSATLAELETSSASLDAIRLVSAAGAHLLAANRGDEPVEIDIHAAARAGAVGRPDENVRAGKHTIPPRTLRQFDFSA